MLHQWKILLKKNSEEAIKYINKISGNKYNLTSFIGKVNKPQTLILDSKYTLSVNERGYSIAILEGENVQVIEFNGKNKREFKLNIKAEMEKIKNKSEEVSIKSIDYSKSLESMYGYFEYYYLEATNIRQTKLTITDGRLDGTQMSHFRNVDSSLPEQSWEDKADLFLGQLINSGRLGGEVASNIHSLSREVYESDAQGLIDAEDIFMHYNEKGYNTSETTRIAAIASMIISELGESLGESIDYFTSKTQTFTDMGMTVASFPVYMSSINRLEDYYDDFKNE